MEKNKSIVLIGILFIGIVCGYFIGNLSLNKNKMHEMPNGMMMHNDHSGSSMEDMMHSMSSSLEGKYGADFDREFLIQMIVHHEGAVDMARQVLEKSTNSELRDFAQGIIDAQTTEIKMMNNWLSGGASVSTSPTAPVTPQRPSPTTPATPAPEEPVRFCTMEAKLCPDGVTYVGRGGLNCAFSKCPGEI